MAGTTPICCHCGKPILAGISWGFGGDAYHPECSNPSTELATLRARLAAAEKVVEAARIALRFMERGTMSIGIQYEIGVQLKEALTAYQEHSDG